MGQCFLCDNRFVQEIVDTAEISSEDLIVEIGAGLGTLTSALAEKAMKVIAIERDRDLVKVLGVELAGRPNIEVLEADALEFDFQKLPVPVKVVGNIPYNISSPLVFYLLDHSVKITKATIMLQREVADRLVAMPGSRCYGIPSVMCRQKGVVRFCFDVPNKAFIPEPKVNSAVISIEMRPSPLVDVDDDLFRRTVQASFSARRKMLRNALARSFSRERVEEALRQTGIDGGRRGETLTVEEFGALTHYLK
jgi:16S rRNA (adenine1518-N6/adenine1519-N6)-dimethyltransferase